ncbi:heme exporter protein CcmD [Nitratireductor basaltis]|uniref:Heme exporter protein D n=1 Tax=Nitratireductor basaltis TaxID=472175 RepID=A0A084U6L7_9HYPH|nr:heme exporter protein CcmD [Nitratireductor basaltis]KFB08603.1 Thioredoxin-related cycX 3' region protein, inner membrane protein [Nitratireductor basaltis]
MSHAAYVALAYGAAVLLIGGLVVWIITDQRARKREIAELEARGVHRRARRKGEQP